MFLVNPASANGSTGRRWPELAARAAALGIDGETLLSERPGHLSELAGEAVAGGATSLVAVGGDGTAHEVVNGLAMAGAGGQVELALIPLGTGMDLARSLRIPKRFDDALEVVRNGRPSTVDIGRATYTTEDGEAQAYFVKFAGAGISGAIAARANRTTKALGGKAAFIWATISTTGARPAGGG